MYKHLHLRFLQNVEHTSGIFSFVYFFFFQMKRCKATGWNRDELQKGKKKQEEENSVFIIQVTAHWWLLESRAVHFNQIILSQVFVALPMPLTLLHTCYCTAFPDNPCVPWFISLIWFPVSWPLATKSFSDTHHPHWLNPFLSILFKTSSSSNYPVTSDYNRNW